MADSATAVPPDNGMNEEEAWWGWVATFVAVLAYGSFGVPIKQTKKYNVHPLVLQSYKTISLFACCWFVLLMDGIDLRFTNWGYVSGALWVLGGTGGIYAIRAAGMAVAIGTWASVMIIVNFIWGALVFREPIANLSSAVGALSCLGLGVIGMSHFSAPNLQLQMRMQQQQQPAAPSTIRDNDIEKATATTSTTKAEALGRPPTLLRQRRSSSSGETKRMTTADDDVVENDNKPSAMSVQRKGIGRKGDNAGITTAQAFLSRIPKLILLNPRRAGILGAVFNGIMTGSSLFPIHYAKRQGFGGANYLISLACGSMAANTVLWFLYFLYNYCYCYYYSYDEEQQRERQDDEKINVTSLSSSSSSSHTLQQQSHRHRSFRSLISEAYQRMPSWYLKQIWVPGFIAGAILALGQLCSVISVTYLGQAVGNSIIQLKILVSGLFGIFWYKEITGFSTIAGWFASATLAIVGIVWLSLERLAAKK